MKSAIAPLGTDVAEQQQCGSIQYLGYYYTGGKHYILSKERACSKTFNRIILDYIIVLDHYLASLRVNR